MYSKKCIIRKYKKTSAIYFLLMYYLFIAALGLSLVAAHGLCLVVAMGAALSAAGFSRCQASP